MSADSLARGYSMFVTYLAEPAVRSLAIGCVAGVALWAFRVKRVTTHLVAWTAVLCAALAMPMLGAFLPRVPVAVPETPLIKSLQTGFERGPARTVQYEVTASVQSATPMAQAGGAELATSSKSLSETRLDHSAHATKVAAARHASRKPGFDATQFTVRAAPGAVSASALTPNVSSTPVPPVTEVPQRSFALPWAALVLGVYLLGVAVLFTRLLVGMWFSRRLECAAESIADREALRLLRFRSCIAGLAKGPALKESAMLTVPATVGVRRAVILLPNDWSAWTEEQLDAILAHEISHVARHDALTQMLSLVHRAIFWFSPLSWWLDKQLTDLAEQASDEAALAAGADRARYAETLVGFFKQLGAAPGRVWWQGVSMAKATKASSAERRVGRILAWKESMSMRKSFALAVIALAAPIVFLAASVHPFIAQAQDKPPAPPQNVIQPGGPVAPALPNAPKGGVNGGVVTTPMPPAPLGGVVALANMPTPPAAAPAFPNAPAGGVNGGVAAAPNMGTTPIAPPALAGPRVLRGSQIPALVPATPAVAPIASDSPFAGETPLPGIAPYFREGSFRSDASIQDAEAQVRAAKQKLDATQAACQAASSNLIAAKKLIDRLEAASASDSKLRAAKQQLAALEAASDAHNSQLLAANQEMLEAKKALRDAVAAAQQESSTNITNGSLDYGGGPRYVLMYGNSNDVSMSGSDEDLEHARKLRQKISGDFIWFERDEKPYIITDASFIAKVRALFAPEDALAKQQDELGRQQDALGKKQDALGEQEDNIKVKVPDISPDIDRVRAELDELRKQSGATQSELGRLQSELGRLQSQVGGYQSRAGAQQSVIGAQQSELGRQQSELGRKQAELGRQESEISRNATKQLRGMFDDAIAKGIAKPE